MSIVSKEDTDLDELALTLTPDGNYAFNEAYKTLVFQIWYKIGKPGKAKLRENIPVFEGSGRKPSTATLNNWIVEFKETAIVLDSEVAQKLQEHMIAEKIEMLDRHAKAGVKMQDMAVEYLDAHKEELKVPMAVKMLVEGIRIERESRGIPQALEKMLDKSDEELFKEVQELLNKAPVEFEQLENGDDNEKEM